jgi:hypothetical protein
MGKIELKSSIHKIVDEIESEYLLKSIYEFLKTKETSDSGRAWDNLTEEQRQEILLSYEESEDENNLIDAKEIFKRG